METLEKLSIRLNALPGDKGFIRAVVKHEIDTNEWALILRLVRKHEREMKAARRRLN